MAYLLLKQQGSFLGESSGSGLQKIPSQALLLSMYAVAKVAVLLSSPVKGNSSAR